MYSPSPISVPRCLLLLLSSVEAGAAPFCPPSCRCEDSGAVRCRLDSEAEYVLRSLPGATDILEVRGPTDNSLRAEFLAHLSGLRRLEVASVPVDPNLLDGLPDLLELCLDQASLPDSGQTSSKLRILDISNSTPPHLPLQNHTHLVHLRLTSVGLEFLPDFAFSTCENLEVLDLSKNQLESISNISLYGLIKLKTLDLSHNRLTILLDNCFIHLTSVEQFLMEGNNLSTLYPRTFDHLTRVKYLALGDKNHTVTKYSFIGLRSLPELTLMNIHLALLEEHTFSDLDSLENLTLVGRITYVGDRAFSDIRNLKNLNLSSCEIKELSSKSFEGLFKMRSLDISHNNLYYLPANLLDGLRELRFLDISFNFVKALSKEFAEIFIHLTSLRLLNNPWDCSCEAIAWSRGLGALCHLEGCPACPGGETLPSAYHTCYLSGSNATSKELHR